MTALDRRDFLRLSALGGVGLGLALDPKPIVVLGAGLAGLCAARLLVEAGHQVVVLEAQRRPGGRVLTLREPFSDGLYAEAGAGRIPDTHAITRHWVKMFGLSLDEFYPTTLADIEFQRGKRIRIPRGSNLNMAQVPLNLTPEERK